MQTHTHVAAMHQTTSRWKTSTTSENKFVPITIPKAVHACQSLVPVRFKATLTRLSISCGQDIVRICYEQKAVWEYERHGQDQKKSNRCMYKRRVQWAFRRCRMVYIKRNDGVRQKKKHHALKDARGKEPLHNLNTLCEYMLTDSFSRLPSTQHRVP